MRSKAKVNGGNSWRVIVLLMVTLRLTSAVEIIDGDSVILNKILYKQWISEELLETKGYKLCRRGERRPDPESCRIFLECNHREDAYRKRVCPDPLIFDQLTSQCLIRSRSCISRFRQERSVLGELDKASDPDMGSGYGENTDNALDAPLRNGTADIAEPIPDSTDLTTKLNVTTTTKKAPTEPMLPIFKDSTAEMPQSNNTTTPATTTPTTTTTTTVQTPLPTNQTMPTTFVTNATTPVTNATTTVTQTTRVVIITDKSSPKPPPYDIITEPTNDITTRNASVIADDVTKSSQAGIIIGVLVVLLVVGVIIGVLVYLVKKKKVNMPKKIRKVSVTRKKIITKMENPQYQSEPGKDYRFSRDSALHIGGKTVNLTKFNNPNLADTPTPRVLQNEDPYTRSSLPKSIASRREKRKAPAPPNPFGEEDNELYEKASQASLDVELQTFTVQNENAAEPTDDGEQSCPLLNNSKDKKTPEKSKDRNDNSDQDAGAEDVEADTNKQTDSLLPKVKSGSKDKLSVDTPLDEYDQTKNPFFAD